MLGSTVSELLVTEQGGLADRAWALRDQRNRRIVSAKRVSRLLDFRATYEVEPTPESAGVVRIETPGGDALFPGQEDASARISSIIGAVFLLASGSVEHLRCLQGGTALIDRRRFRPSMYIDTGR